MKKTAVMILGLFLMQVAQADIKASFVVGWGIGGAGDAGGIVDAIPGTIIVFQLINGGGDGLDLGQGGLVLGGSGNDSIIATFTAQVTATPGVDFSDYAVFLGGDVNAPWAADTWYTVSGVNAGDWVYADSVVLSDLGPLDPPETIFYDNGGAGANADGSITGGGLTPTTIELLVASDYGAPSPPVGLHTYTQTASIMCSVESTIEVNGVRSSCSGWTGTGDVPSTGTSNSTGQITLNQNSSITWNWGNTEFWLDIAVVGSGSVNVADGWQPSGAVVPVTATPSAGLLFMGWSGDLMTDYTQTTINLLMDDKKSITATFSNDADGDGLTNADEASRGTDPRDSDSDDDGLLDSFEVYIYNTDPLDADTDNDSLYDGNEVNLYATDPLNPDGDGDGLNDGQEILTYATNPSIADTDGDGLSDGDEVNIYSTDPLVTDTDGDLLSDYEEVVTYSTNPNLADSDADGLDDSAEINTHLTDPNDADSDDDGLSDGMEINTHLTDPNDADSDDDGLSDGLEINTYSTNPNLGDTSGDGILDGYAVLKGLDPTVNHTGIYAILNINKVGSGEVTPDSDLYAYGTNLTLEATGSEGMLFISWSGSITGDYTTAITNIILNGHMDITATFSDDADGDGILNTNETALGTNPRSSDSDEDQLSDYDEVYVYPTSPTNPDVDGDGLLDGEEILIYNSDPNMVDTDGDGFGDGYEVFTGFDPALTNSTPDTLSEILTAVEFRFNAASGVTYQVEATADLSNTWEVVETNIMGEGGIMSRLYSTDGKQKRFFRARRD